MHSNNVQATPHETGMGKTKIPLACQTIAPMRYVQRSLGFSIVQGTARRYQGRTGTRAHNMSWLLQPLHVPPPMAAG